MTLPETDVQLVGRFVRKTVMHISMGSLLMRFKSGDEVYYDKADVVEVRTDEGLVVAYVLVTETGEEVLQELPTLLHILHKRLYVLTPMHLSLPTLYRWVSDEARNKKSA